MSNCTVMVYREPSCNYRLLCTDRADAEDKDRKEILPRVSRGPIASARNTCVAVLFRQDSRMRFDLVRFCRRQQREGDTCEKRIVIPIFAGRRIFYLFWS